MIVPDKATIEKGQVEIGPEYSVEITLTQAQALYIFNLCTGSEAATLTVANFLGDIPQQENAAEITCGMLCKTMNLVAFESMQEYNCTQHLADHVFPNIDSIYEPEVVAYARDEKGRKYSSKGLNREEIIQDLAGITLTSPKNTLIQPPQEWRTKDPKTNVQDPNWHGEWQRENIGHTKSKWRSFENKMFSAWEPYKVATLDDEHTIRCMHF